MARTTIGGTLGINKVGTWTSDTFTYPSSTNFRGIENFEGGTGNTIAASGTSGSDYDAADTGIYYQGDQSWKWGDSTWSSGETTILTVTWTSIDLSANSTLHFQFYVPTGNTGDCTWVIEMNDGVAGWQAVTPSTTFNNITVDTWTEVTGTISGLTLTASTGFRITLLSAEAGSNDMFNYIDLIQVENTTANCEWRNLTVTYSKPANSDITVDILNSSGTALESGIAIAATIDLSTYATIDEDIKIRFNLGSTGGSPTISDFTLNWKPDQLGDWGGAWDEVETLSGAGEVTDGLRNVLVDMLRGASATAPTYGGVGTGTVAPSVGDTSLGTEVGPRGTTSSSRSTHALTYVTIIGNPIANGYTVSEFGLFNVSTSGTCLERVVFTPTLKHAYEQFRFTVKVNVTGTITTVGLTELAMFLDGDTVSPPDRGQYGDDGTFPTAADTALGNAIPATKLAFSLVTYSNLQVTYEHFLDSSTGNSNTLREYGILRNSDSKLFIRILTVAPLTKTSAIQYQRDLKINVRKPG